MTDFHYDLPDELIARHPANPRDSSRLLVPLGGAAMGGGATSLLAAHVGRAVLDLCAERAAARAPDAAAAYADLRFSDVSRLLPRGAHLVFNESRVFAARLFGVAQSAAQQQAASTEILLLSPDQRSLEPAEALCAPVGAHTWRAMVRASALPGDAYLVGAASGGAPALLARIETIYSNWIEEGETDGVEASIRLAPVAGAPPSLADALAALGEVPIPPYLRRSQEAGDSEAYQTVYAHPQRTGSVAAPTAGLHFTPATLEALRARGVASSRVALHVGAGTFRPVTAAQIGGHEMHSERFALAAAELLAIADSADAGRPLVAVGTTSARALESSYWLGTRVLAEAAAGGGVAAAAHGALHLAQWEAYELAAAAASGGRALPSAAAALRAVAALAAGASPAELRASTSLCIAPGYGFRVVDGLLTNLHQPDSTLLLLVGALLGGADRIRELYAHAVRARYRFLSYGDACLLVRQPPPLAQLNAPGEGRARASASDEQAATLAVAAVPSAPAAAGPWWGGEAGGEGRRAPDGRKVLLHSCCAPCSGAMIAEMREAGFDVTIFFYNPNIHPRREYELRKAENVRYAEALGVPFVDADYDADEWFKRARGLEFSPERGARCTMCFDMRMERTALYAHEHGYAIITTTNATSRWKDAAQVDGSGLRAAARYADVEYWFRNWQTDAMSARKYEINAQQRFYKQEYCGCSYSLRDSNLWRAKQGLPPVEIEARDSVYTDPLADSAEESREVVDGFFRDNQAFEQELKATYGKRRKDAKGEGDGNNW